MSLLGEALRGQCRYAEAEPLLVAGYEGLEAREATIPPPGRPQLAEAADRVVALYEAWGRPEQAAACASSSAGPRPNFPPTCLHAPDGPGAPAGPSASLLSHSGGSAYRRWPFNPERARLPPGALLAAPPSGAENAAVASIIEEQTLRRVSLTSRAGFTGRSPSGRVMREGTGLVVIPATQLCTALHYGRLPGPRVQYRPSPPYNSPDDRGTNHDPFNLPGRVPAAPATPPACRRPQGRARLHVMRSHEWKGKRFTRSFPPIRSSGSFGSAESGFTRGPNVSGEQADYDALIAPSARLEGRPRRTGPSAATRARWRNS